MISLEPGDVGLSLAGGGDHAGAEAPGGGKLGVQAIHALLLLLKFGFEGDDKSAVVFDLCHLKKLFICLVQLLLRAG